MQPFLGWKLHIDAHAVCQIAGLFDQIRRCAGNCFGMDIAPETVFCPQEKEGFVHQFHGISRIFNHTGA